MRYEHIFIYMWLRWKTCKCFCSCSCSSCCFSLFEDENTENFANKWKEINEYFFSVKKTTTTYFIELTSFDGCKRRKPNGLKEERTIDSMIDPRSVASPSYPIYFVCLCAVEITSNLCAFFSFSSNNSQAHMPSPNKHTQKKKSNRL